MATAGKLLLAGGAVLMAVGGALLLASRLGLTRLPGDLVLRRGNVTVYAPLGLMILLSVVLTLVLNLFLRR